MSLLKETVGAIVAQDPKSRAAARARLEQLTMPYWALGRLMDLAEDLAGMTRSLRPPVERKAVVVMAGDHGVAAEGVSKYPQEVTPQMVYNFVNGGAGINALARVSGARVVVVDMGVAGDLGPLAAEGKILSRRIGAGTGNMAVGPAMSREDAIRSVEAGIEVALMLAAETDLFATGDMGIANTTPSSAIVSVMTGAAVADVTGRGTGIDDAGLSLKVAVIEKALAVNRPDPDDAMDVLMKVGGFEIGGIAGLILGAASLRKPVLLDGFISTAGALIAQGLAPRAVDYMIAAHKSVEAGHRIALQKLGKEPLLDLGLRLGEGTGAALAMPIVEGAVRVLTEVATFEEAAVSGAVT
ncbi:MAG: nicotinate-nucleotide--dimethylbenzimidazole phosphoribosyltransferase [Deltaproteobacteria bacterium]|nr:nicotinate-nucleotide--dimethylbenzimidazole phosphoribosyltransferase [Deltaproteobacteria bacterium]